MTTIKQAEDTVRAALIKGATDSSYTSMNNEHNCYFPNIFLTNPTLFTLAITALDTLIEANAEMRKALDELLYDVCGGAEQPCGHKLHEQAADALAKWGA